MAGVCSTDIFVIRSKAAVHVGYLTHLLRSTQFNVDVLRGIGGAQLPRVSYEYLSALTIPLPPLEVQHQIVAEIEGYQKSSTVPGRCLTTTSPAS
ncbi:restriction endonuclease subunit S [Polaromonas sp. P1(28)-8]|nr:restriction endonuclease subunit S [Polaromonas sp. P1(28)-8]